MNADAILRRLTALESQSVAPAINISVNVSTGGAPIQEAARRRVKRKPVRSGAKPVPKKPPTNKQGDPVMLGAFE